MKVACIPAFNVEATIGDIIGKSKKYVDMVIVCNDGSVDRTEEIAKQNGARVLNHETNQGYGAAIKTLFEETKKLNDIEIMVTLDSDGQHDPNEIPRLFEPIIKQETDVVIGSRFLSSENGEIPKYRKKGIKLITSVANLGTGLDISDAQSGFRAYSKIAIQTISINNVGMSASVEILRRIGSAGLRVKEVPINVKYKNLQSSTQKPITHGMGVLLNTLRFMTVKRPLTFYGIPGLGFLIIGLAFGSKFLQYYATHKIVLSDVLVVSVGSLVIGTVLIATSILLFAISTLLDDIKK